MPRLPLPRFLTTRIQSCAILKSHRFVPCLWKKNCKIGNVIEEVVDLARQINLEVDSDDIQELLDSHNQKLTVDELIEMHKEEQKDTEKLESLDLVQSEDQTSVRTLTESLSLIGKELRIYLYAK
ncbi:uncharacterized protein TNCV_739671 [Trichonephila clavipes]|nr:uncharacterized protein TNCV_739671 [Trichonephila clavipes]